MINFQAFPDLSHANEDGLLAMGGDLSVDTLVSAYAQGIFPWFNEGQPILWWSPDPRLVLLPDQIRITRSLKKSIRNKYTVTCNQVFEQVIEGCALRGTSSTGKQLRDHTWITEEMHEAYMQLHQSGYAHSIEVWNLSQQLVGGLYGVFLGKVFFGESMFSRERDASKVGLAHLCYHMIKNQYRLIDCQIASDHLLSLGAIEIPRSEFLDAIEDIDIQSPNTEFANNFLYSGDEVAMLFSQNSDINNT